MAHLKRSLAFLFLALFCEPAVAGVTITFYSHQLGSSFPHAFVLLEGKPNDGIVVGGNFGFSAKHLSPAILLGSVEGEIESSGPDYVAHSQAHWRMNLSEAQYDAVRSTVDKWRRMSGKSYNLKQRNCVSFVADVARSLGLDVVEAPKLMMKPQSFLDDLYHRNEALKTVSADAAVPTLAAIARR